MDKTVAGRVLGHAIPASVLALALAAMLNACTSNVHTGDAGTELAHARDAYAQAAADPSVAFHAGTALAEAKRALMRAEAAAASDADPQEQAHLAYLAERRVEIARARAREEAAKQDIEALMRQRARASAPTQQSESPEQSQTQREALWAHAQAQGARDAALAAQLAQSRQQTATSTSAAIQRLESDLAALEVTTKETDRGLVVTLEDELFAGAHPTPALERKLDPLIAFLRTNPERQMIVEGYTDAQTPVAESLRLSQARAEAVRDQFVQHGIGRDRILVRGYGPDFPVASNDTAAGRLRNRRIELVVAPPGETARQQLR